MPTVPGAGATVIRKFTTRATTGVPTTLAGTPAVSIYKDGSTTQSTTGVTLTVDFDAVTGLNHVAIDTSADGTFYANESKFYLVITAGTVGGTSVVGEVVGDFDLAAPFGPTTGGVNVVQFLGTASAGAAGYAGIDWSQVNAPTTTVNLSGTTISTSQAVATVTTATNLTNLPAVPTDWLTAAGVKADAVTKIQAGLATPTNITAGTITTVTNLTNLPAITTDWLTGTGVAASAVTKIQSGLATPTNITAGTITTVTNLTNAPTAGDLTATMKTSLTTAILAGVVDLATTGHTTSGTFGAAMVAAGGSGDPWGTLLPGAYALGTAGYILGTYLDMTVSTIGVDTATLVADIDTQLSATHGAGAWGGGGMALTDLMGTPPNLDGKADAAITVSHCLWAALGWTVGQQVLDPNALTQAIKTPAGTTIRTQNLDQLPAPTRRT